MRFVKAFTLAEVLITLAIIGAVAVLTIPDLVQKYQEKAYITKLKKVFSVLNNAYQLIIFEQGGISKWTYLPTEYELDSSGHVVVDSYGSMNDLNGYPNADMIYQKFKPYLKVVKDCNSLEKGCFTEEAQYINKDFTLNLVSTQFGVRKFVTLFDGIGLGFLSPDAIYVDVNGLKKPNKVGVDIFQLHIGENSIEVYDDMKGPVKCYTNEWACSGWVLRNENLDYLHCKDLSWTGKRKCS